MFLIKRKTNQHNLFISIGGGINQIPLIEEAKKLGLHIIGVDTNICAAGMHNCDIRIQESIENFNEILQKLKEFIVDGEIKGILTKSFGPAIKTACFISGKLNIPLLPFDKVDGFINKEKMKKYFKINKINSPEFTIYQPKNKKAKKNKIPYPFVIKPTVGHAKNDVELIQNSKDFYKYINNVSNNTDYIIEKYVKGDEIIAIGIVFNKKFYLVEMTDKLKSPPPYFVDIMHISPSKYSHLWDKVQQIGQNISDSFEIFTSPLLMELIITENEEIFVIETAPEFGGEFLSDVLIPERTKYNIIRESIKAVVNRNFTPPKSRKIRKAVVVKYITGTNGNLASFNPIKYKSNEIIFSRIFKDIGSEIRKPMTNHDRVGVVITKGKTVEEAVKTAENAEIQLNVKIIQ